MGLGCKCLIDLKMSLIELADLVWGCSTPEAGREAFLRGDFDRDCLVTEWLAEWVERCGWWWKELTVWFW